MEEEVFGAGKLEGGGLFDAMFNELMRECRHSAPGARLSARLRTALEKLRPSVRRALVGRTAEGCAPLFVAARRGNAELAEYLVHVCGADLEQRGCYSAGDAAHRAPPLWAAAVEGRLDVMRVLVEAGADVDARSDSGSTAARSACFMTHEAAVRFLAARGADLAAANHSGGTCLINAVQSARLCAFLLRRGVPVDARDAQLKTALHYAVQEHRADTARLLLRHGADPTLRSRAGDDALRTAALRGNEAALRTLAELRAPPAAALADAYELLGATQLDELGDSASAVAWWQRATALRERAAAPKPAAPPPRALAPAAEWREEADLAAAAADMDALRTQALLVAVRVLGEHHKDTVLRIMHRGASYGDAFRYQRCIDLWLWALEIRIEKDTLLYADTCHTACAITRLMLDAQAARLDRAQGLPRFQDVLRVFTLLTDHLPEAHRLLSVRPVHRKQAESWDRTLRCLTHLLHVLAGGARTADELATLHRAAAGLVRRDPRSAAAGDALLHLAASCLNVVRSTYFTSAEEAAATAAPGVFPSEAVARLLLAAGADPNAANAGRATPLHVAAAPYNRRPGLVRALLAAGAHVDAASRLGERPSALLAAQICVVKYETLKCLAARAVPREQVREGDLPATLLDWVDLHQPQQAPADPPHPNIDPMTIDEALRYA